MEMIFILYELICCTYCVEGGFGNQARLVWFGNRGFNDQKRQQHPRKKALFYYTFPSTKHRGSNEPSQSRHISFVGERIERRSIYSPSPHAFSMHISQHLLQKGRQEYPSRRGCTTNRSAEVAVAKERKERT